MRLQLKVPLHPLHLFLKHPPALLPVYLEKRFGIP
jgi:hypothetical protein